MRPTTQSAKENFAACVAMMVICFIFVTLRCAVRLTALQVPTPSDWLCLLALLLFFAYAVIIINFICNTSAYGAFDFATTTDLVELQNLLKVGFQVEILFGTGLSVVKFSILAFYYELFHVHIVMRRIVVGTAVVCLAWFIASTLLIVLQCTPPQAFWETFLSPQYCLSNTRVLLGFEISNLFIDLAILAIPVNMVRQLQLATAKKTSLLMIFALGGFVCVTSIVRLSAIWRPPNVDANYDFPMTMMWSTIQLGTAIVCACLPTLGRLLSFLAKPVQHLYNTYRIHSSPQHGSGKIPSGGSQKVPWVKIGDDGYHASAEGWAPGHSRDGSDHLLQSMPNRGVLVQREVQVA
ncbi:integral membrane protein [Seiridium cupressi]